MRVSVHNKSQKNNKYIFPLHFCTCQLSTSNILYCKWTVLLLLQLSIFKRRNLDANNMTQSGIFGHHTAGFLPSWQPVNIMSKWCVILTVTLPWNLVTCCGKLHVNTFFLNWVGILVYLLDMYVEQVAIVEGTKKLCNGKIKQTTKDLNYDVISA